MRQIDHFESVIGAQHAAPLLDRQDTAALAKTLVLTCALAAGAAYGGLTFFHKAGSVSNIFAGALIAGVFGTVIFSIWHALWRARRARRDRRESHR